MRICADSFAIPHDLRILKEVFTLEPGGYNTSNSYWTGYSITKLVAGLPNAEREALQKRISAITAKYDALSQRYQQSKTGNEIPLS